MRGTPWSRIREQKNVYKEFLETVGNGKPTGSVVKETIAVSATILNGVEKWQSNPFLNFFHAAEWSKSIVNSKSGRSPSGRMSRWPCKDYLEGTCNNTLQNACSTRPIVVVGLGKSAHSHIVRLLNSRQRSKKEWWQKCCGYDEKGKLARKRICLRCLSRSAGETW